MAGPHARTRGRVPQSAGPAPACGSSCTVLSRGGERRGPAGIARSRRGCLRHDSHVLVKANGRRKMLQGAGSIAYHFLNHPPLGHGGSMTPFDLRRTLALACSVLGATGLLATAPAHASISPAAAAVVKRYLEVTGGAAAFAAESTTYTHAHVSGFGFSGTYESWSARPYRHLSKMALGPFTLSESSIGGTAWRPDPAPSMPVDLADTDDSAAP